MFIKWSINVADVLLLYVYQEFFWDDVDDYSDQNSK